MDRGFLIIFEGIDGAGKSTHCRLLAEFLQEKGIPVVQLREPTDGVWGQKIRKLLTEGRGETTPEEELSYFINDRKDDVERNIGPALENNKVVLIDRYYYSTAAYQGALGFDPVKICEDNEAFAPKPDLVLMFRLKPEEGLARISESRESFSSFEKADYLTRVQAIFDTFQGPNIHRVDANQSKEQVQEEVKRLATALLPIAGEVK